MDGKATNNFNHMDIFLQALISLRHTVSQSHLAGASDHRGYIYTDLPTT